MNIKATKSQLKEKQLKIACILFRTKVRFFVEVGKAKGACGGLSQLNAGEALIVARQLRLAGIKDVHIYNVKSGVRLTEAEIEAVLSMQHNKPPLPIFQADAISGRSQIT